MNIRHLRYFVMLAREKHHGRAAAASHVTQPTLSGAIAQLERELGVPLIVRHCQRFGGLTPEGERTLQWAQRIVADQEALGQEIAAMRDGLAGVLRFGIIPAATPAAPIVTARFCARHPQVSLRRLPDLGGDRARARCWRDRGGHDLSRQRAAARRRQPSALP